MAPGKEFEPQFTGKTCINIISHIASVLTIELQWVKCNISKQETMRSALLTRQNFDHVETVGFESHLSEDVTRKMLLSYPTNEIGLS